MACSEVTDNYEYRMDAKDTLGLPDNILGAMIVDLLHLQNILCLVDEEI